MLDIMRFRAQMEMISHRNPGLVVKLLPDRKKSHAEISENPSGGFSLKWSDKLLHSLKDPEGEARHILDRVAFEPDRSQVIFGMGLGHLAMGARARLPEQSALIIIEPDVRILREVLAAVDLRSLLYDDRVHLVAGRDWPETFRIMIRRCEDAGCRPSTSILALPAYRTYFHRALAEARSVLAQSLNERDIDTQTRVRLWDLWNGNLTQNLPQILSSAPVRIFTSTFQGIPAVLVGAGPSLDDVLPDIARVREGALLITVDTALAPLLSAGCEPDIVLAMDAQEENATDFTDLPPHQTTLLFDAFCYPTIPAQYPAGSRILSLTGHILSDIGGTIVLRNGLLPLLEFILGQPFGFLQNGGSVITAGFDLARLADCSALCIAGVDLSYPGLLTHSKRTRRFGKRYGLQNRFATAEWDFYEEFSQKARMRLDTAGGGKVWSDRVLVMYKQWMEDSASKAGLPCFTLGNPRGLTLHGYPPVSAAEFLKTHGADRSEIESRLSRCRRYRPDFDSAKILERIRQVRDDIAGLDHRPASKKIGAFDLAEYVEMASFAVSERLKDVLSMEPESSHRSRREQAARAVRQFVTPFLDGLEEVIKTNKLRE
ncbi:motility associated factor glycosyltransferase family protein [bacterium]|nr:motility associated factor glycosyltransferase family protein [bacterium]